ncbi:MAG: substrate-binding domain-containing protein [Erythrobacter sp.]|nr:substrate-binding domain-containing protein [Erythrobacter sp.]NCQ62399.1 substrate-binding domain-containing protein [Alphaproteobacteria bacterium]
MSTDPSLPGKPVRVTSFDVAERAGVNQSTVSRALAGSPQVTPATRERVVAVAKELGYTVDHRASGLRKGRTDTIAVVILQRPEDKTPTGNPFYFELLGSICEAASERGLETLVSLQSENGRLTGDYVKRGQADGTIVIGSARNSTAWGFFQQLQRSESSLVFWGSPFDEARWIRSDNVAGGALATRHLIDRGYRRIAFVGPLETGPGQFAERFEGYCDALAEHGLEPLQASHYPDGDRIAQGYHAALELLDRNPDIDAFFAASDRLAFGVLERVRESGGDVPDKCGIVGFDGMSAGTVCNPPLTTVAPDLEKAAKALLAAALDDDKRGTGRVPVKLIERASVRALPAGKSPGDC